LTQIPRDNDYCFDKEAPSREEKHFLSFLFGFVFVGSMAIFFPFDFVLFRKIRQYSSWGGGAGGGARGEGGGAARAGREEEMLQKAIPKLVLKKNH